MQLLAEVSHPICSFFFWRTPSTNMVFRILAGLMQLAEWVILVLYHLVQLRLVLRTRSVMQLSVSADLDFPVIRLFRHISHVTRMKSLPPTSYSSNLMMMSNEHALKASWIRCISLGIGEKGTF